MKLTHKFAEMTPENRPQDPHMNGTGLRFEEALHINTIMSPIPTRVDKLATVTPKQTSAMTLSDWTLVNLPRIALSRRHCLKPPVPAAIHKNRFKGSHRTAALPDLSKIDHAPIAERAILG